MSGLCDGRCRALFACRPPPFAPRMVRPRPDRAPEVMGRLDLHCPYGTNRDRVTAEWSTVVGNPHRLIDPFFYLQVGGPEVVVDLIEAPLLCEGEALAQTPGRLDAQDAIQLSSCGTGPMQIGGLGRLYRKPLVVEQLRCAPEVIRRVQSRDSR